MVLGGAERGPGGRGERVWGGRRGLHGGPGGPEQSWRLGAVRGGSWELEGSREAWGGLLGLGGSPGGGDPGGLEAAA